jgi:replicative DNA helicase
VNTLSYDWQAVLDENGLPCDLEAEKTILGSTQLNNDLIAEIATLSEDHFSIESHRLIRRSMLNLHQQGMGIDPVTLGADLRARDLFEQVGGATYLASLIDGVPRTDTLEPYVRILKQKAKERRLIERFNQSIFRLVDGDEPGTILADMERFCTQESEPNTKAFPGFYESLDDFFSAEFEDPEAIIYGIHRGEVGELAAVTNYGKSTLLLNLCLSMAGGQMCLPLLPYAPDPRRVIYVDCESSASRLRSDIRVMLRNISNPRLARENFKPVVDADIDGFPLNLSQSSHLKRLMEVGKKHKADLIVIDTVGSAFELHNENDNAEVTRRVMNPLKKMARELNCAVIFCHHIGKATETQTGEGAYKGRGGSAFGALSRVVFTIEKDQKHGAGYIVLNCAKSKGVMFEPVLMKLNQETRWFELCAEKPAEPPKPPTAAEIAEFVGGRVEVRTEEIKQYFAGRGSSRTISDRLQEAERVGLIFKPNQKAPWRLCNGKNGDFEEPPQLPDFSTDDSFVQCATPIGIAQLHKPASNGHSRAEIAYCSCGATGIQFTSCDRCGEFLT